MTDMAAAAIDLVNLGFRYASAPEPVFQSLNLRAKQSEWLGIVGPSGCGKSTLASLMIGLCEPSEGEVRLRGTPPRQLQSSGQIGISLQLHALVPWLSAINNIALPASSARGAALEKAGALAESFGLGARSRFLPDELSGGMKVRASLARSLINDPSFVIWDEPFASLDDITISRICSYIEGLRSERDFSLVFISHQLETVARLADRCLCFPSSPGGEFTVMDLMGFGPTGDRTANALAEIRQNILDLYL